jgi:hypothetical protein
MNDLKGRQAAFNAESRDRWGSFADHRKRVSELLVSGAEPGRSRLCVLGAGNGNDLDLPALLRAHREVHLLDLDDEALAQGVARQGVAGHPSLHHYGGVDVTGMLEAIASWSPHTPIRPEDLAACADEPVRHIGALLPGPFDCVASTCLLSQLILSLVYAVGEGHPQFLGLMQAVRAGHLRLLTHLLAPGGTAVLITDVVSSETFPTLGSIPEGSLAGLLNQLVRDRNFFHGVNPAVLSSLPAQDPILKAQVADLELIPPWRWDLGPRLYLVWAMRYRKRGVGAPGNRPI